MPRRSRRYAWLLAAASLWMAAILLAPWAKNKAWPATGFSYFFFAQICHQLPARSFAWMGYAFPVCHRCMGLYSGFFLGLVLTPKLSSFSDWLIGNPRRTVLFFLPLCLDLLSANTAATRFGTGLTAAFPVALLAWMAVEQFPRLRSLLVSRH